jgi:hypothetical protein
MRKPAAYVELRFLDGEVLSLPFVKADAASAFQQRAQGRHDLLSARFVDPGLQESYARVRSEGENGT